MPPPQLSPVVFVPFSAYGFGGRGGGLRPDPPLGGRWGGAFFSGVPQLLGGFGGAGSTSSVSVPRMGTRLLYSWELSREKTFVDFKVLWLFAKVFYMYVKFSATSEQSAQVFSAKIHQFAKVFSRESFLLYGMLGYT